MKKVKESKIEKAASNMLFIASLCVKCKEGNENVSTKSDMVAKQTITEFYKLFSDTVNSSPNYKVVIKSPKVWCELLYFTLRLIDAHARERYPNPQGYFFGDRSYGSAMLADKILNKDKWVYYNKGYWLNSVYVSQLACAIQGTHPTLLQSMMRSIIISLQEYTRNTGEDDRLTEYQVKFLTQVTYYMTTSNQADAVYLQYI